MPVTALAVVLAQAEYGIPGPSPDDSVTFGLVSGAIFIALGLVIVGLTALSARQSQREE